MVGWHINTKDISLSKLPERVEDLGVLVFCSPWGHKESNMS